MVTIDWISPFFGAEFMGEFSRLFASPSELGALCLATSLIVFYAAQVNHLQLHRTFDRIGTIFLVVLGYAIWLAFRFATNARSEGVYLSGVTIARMTTYVLFVSTGYLLATLIRYSAIYPGIWFWVIFASMGRHAIKKLEGLRDKRDRNAQELKALSLEERAKHLREKVAERIRK